MTSREYFVVGIRLFGVWEMLRAVDYALECFDMHLGFFRSRDMAVEATYTHWLSYLLIGLILLGFAPRIASIFHSSPRPASAELPPTLPLA